MFQTLMAADCLTELKCIKQDLLNDPLGINKPVTKLSHQVCLILIYSCRCGFEYIRLYLLMVMNSSTWLTSFDL